MTFEDAEESAYGLLGLTRSEFMDAGPDIWTMARYRMEMEETRLDIQIRIAARLGSLLLHKGDHTTLFEMWTGRPWSDSEALQEAAQTQGGLLDAMLG